MVNEPPSLSMDIKLMLNRANYEFGSPPKRLVEELPPNQIFRMLHCYIERGAYHEEDAGKFAMILEQPNNLRFGDTNDGEDFVVHWNQITMEGLVYQLREQTLSYTTNVFICFLGTKMLNHKILKRYHVSINNAE